METIALNIYHIGIVFIISMLLTIGVYELYILLDSRKIEKK